MNPGNNDDDQRRGIPTVVFQSHPAVLLCQPDDASRHSLFEYLRAGERTAGCLWESGRAVNRIITQVPGAVFLDSRIFPAGGYEFCTKVHPYDSGSILFKEWAQDKAAQLPACERGGDQYIASISR